LTEPFSPVDLPLLSPFCVKYSSSAYHIYSSVARLGWQTFRTQKNSSVPRHFGQVVLTIRTQLHNQVVTRKVANSKYFSHRASLDAFRRHLKRVADVIWGWYYYTRL